MSLMTELRWALWLCLAVVSVVFISQFLPQVDKLTMDAGNALVGIGTVSVALVTFFVSSRTVKIDANKQIAIFRMQWSDALREDISVFVSLILSYLVQGKSIDDDVQNIVKQVARIRFRLQRDKHREFIDNMESIVSGVQEYDKSTPSADEIRRKLVLFDLQAEQIIENAWNKARKEIQL